MGEILTNKFGLPETIVQACINDQYDYNPDTISTTTLIDSPKIRILKATTDYHVDVSQKLAALMGTAMHGVLELADINEYEKSAFNRVIKILYSKAIEIESSSVDKANQLKKVASYLSSIINVFYPEGASKYIMEKRMSIEILGKTITGKPDLYNKETGVLYDYKFCSVNQWMKEEFREKWKQQTNIYAYMLELEGYKVNAIRIVAFFKDWKKFDIVRVGNYPPQQIIEIPVEFKNVNDISKFIVHRTKMHIEAENGNIPDCNGKDKWSTSTKYAVTKTGQKRAKAVYDHIALADQYIRENEGRFGKMRVEIRPGESTRCENYCPVAENCEQFKKEKKESADNLKKESYNLVIPNKK